jgi:hypothetical protein
LSEPNQTQSLEPAGTTQPLQVPLAPTPIAPPTKDPWWKAALKWLGEVFLFALGTLYFLALIDSYRPKITITTGPSTDSKAAMRTMFIVSNQGLLPIKNIVYNTFCYEPGNTNSIGLSSTSARNIQELSPLEQYFLAFGDVPTNVFNPVNIAIFRIDLSYKPVFFGKRTDVLYFYGQRDEHADWMWLPTGHHPIFRESFRGTNEMENSKRNYRPTE